MGNGNPKIAGMTTVKKLTNQSGHVEDAAIFNQQPMESFENGRCLCVSITVCYNLSKCILETLQFANIKTGQTS